MIFPPGIPRYIALADALRSRILAGDLPAGRMLPSGPRMAAEYGVSVETVKRATAMLRGEGLLEVRVGLGTAVRDLVDEPRRVVGLRQGSEVEVRMPNPAERAEHQIAEGVPVLVAELGGDTHVYPGDRCTFVCL